MLYALEYFEAKNYTAASWSFNAVLKRESENAYANFLYGASLAELGKRKEAKPYLEKASQIMPSLRDMVKRQPNKLVVEKPTSLFQENNTNANRKDKVAPVVKPKTTIGEVKPAAPVKSVEPNKGGTLFFGSYSCDFNSIREMSNLEVHINLFIKVIFY